GAAAADPGAAAADPGAAAAAAGRAAAAEAAAAGRAAAARTRRVGRAEGCREPAGQPVRWTRSGYLRVLGSLGADDPVGRTPVRLETGGAEHSGGGCQAIAVVRVAERVGRPEPGPGGIPGRRGPGSGGPGAGVPGRGIPVAAVPG